MTTPSLFSRQGPARLIARSLLAAALFLGLAVCAQAAAKKAYDLPADDAAVVLRQFAEQAGVEIVYSAEAVRGVRTNAVAGEFTALDAVNRLIAGTDLLAVQDEKTGAIAVNRTPAPAGPGPRRGSVRSEDGSIVLDEVEISASKVGGLNNQTILRTDEQGALAYSVISRVDIERMGVTSIEELFRLIPQTTDYGSTSLQGSANNPAFAGGATYQNSEVKLRGFSSLQTAILVNGRRLQRGNLSAGPDLNRIPTAAIDRIEILPSSASAI
ncbi:MAG: TonB-dependent receptor, partial [Opitutaceae bacterium]|nr:TonB-dependent receptor [Opitutaceae bacterium]